jgi:hypothetical protein
MERVEIFLIFYERGGKDSLKIPHTVHQKSIKNNFPNYTISN